MAPAIAMGHMRGRDRWSPSNMRMDRKAVVATVFDCLTVASRYCRR
jgi:hypothetical protein